tara:strand:+ start:878 stop:1450 length:573 start_codon:yes stop_codon:yes gene_type:complete
MINSKLDHVKTLDEFYESIRSQQEEAHGEHYCAMHDAINQIAKDCKSYKELGVHQGGTLANALLNPHLKYVEGVDISLEKYSMFLQPIAEQYVKDKKKVLKMKECDSTGIDSLGYGTDILMIDSVHKQHHMRKELELHGQYVKKYIVAHDTHKPDDQLYWCLADWGVDNGWEVMTRNQENVGFTVLKKNV